VKEITVELADGHKEYTVSLPRLRELLLEGVTVFGEVHVAGPSATGSDTTLCGQRVDVRRNFTVALDVFQDLAGLFEAVPVCLVCSSRVPQR